MSDTELLNALEHAFNLATTREWEILSAEIKRHSMEASFREAMAKALREYEEQEA